MGGQAGASTTGAQPSTDRTANIGLDRARYLFVTDQSRHLPLAMTVTVDQSHLHEILVAMANSKLRFQTTQVEFRRQPAGAARPRRRVLLRPEGRAAGGGTLDPVGSARGIWAGWLSAARRGAAAMTTPTLENPNLVEVTIYGVASLYERPREDKKEDKK